ncbi:MAG TPA: potassium channel family protein [Alphaproteobacteria bacterium]|nr:potassium channel family protein [Alphaproteobacteria bacterium]
MTPTEEPAAGRLAMLRRIEDALELPMQILGLVWLGLLVRDLGWGLSPRLEALSTAIWIAFIVDFAVRLAVAPRRLGFLAENWLTVISLLLPALRVLRFARFLRLARGLRLVRILGSLNRGYRVLRRGMRRRGFGYAVALTLLVTFVGAAGMLAFERPSEGGGLAGYGEALWWTAMIMTTLGSEYWPRTPEGRVLCILLALYSFAVFGYVTATIATVFLGADAEAEAPAAAPATSEDIAALRAEIAALRAELKRGE